MHKINGLTQEEINKRIEKKLVNYDTTVPTKSIKRILYDNFFTLFNFINLFLGIAIFLVGSYKNMLFLGVAIINTAISTFQEIHSKRIIDKLSILASTKAKVLRDGKFSEIPINDLVLDDVVEFNTGNQVSTDSIVLDGEVQVDESFITGESHTITKKEGDSILSGSFIVSGKCLCKVEHVGEENYTAKISSGAKYIKKVNSEILKSLKKIIKFLTIAIIPIGISLFCSQLNLEGMTFNEAVVKAVAAIIGMIPEGLVLLTSTVLAVSVIRLSKSKVLVQELYCIETLARVDTVCFDKTGTLTEGSMEVKKVVPIDNNPNGLAHLENILANYASSSEDENATMEAIKNNFKKINTKLTPINKVSFSSATKWSGIYFENEGSYVLGAPEFVLKDNFRNHKDFIDKFSKDYRVLVIAHSKSDFSIDTSNNKTLPDNLELLGLVLILDKIRNEAKDTIKYFYKQNVDIKIISGDNPVTVSQIAKQVEIKNYDKYIDLSSLDETSDYKEIVNKYTIFGRVSPTQKEKLVSALKDSGKTVAMTGDGVNDVLALKKSDCSIAMANGSDAAKSVSQIVLLDSNFASMPKIVNEGRRTINNIQRSASLFLVKTIYSTLLAIMFLILHEEYPFVPIQLSLISIITIGIPSFILALEPNKERISGNFLRNVIYRALPTGLSVVFNIFIISMLTKHNLITPDYSSSLCVVGTGICGIILLFTLVPSKKSEDSNLPFSIFRLSLAIILTLLFILGLTAFKWLFNIVNLTPVINRIIEIIFISIINFILLTLILKYSIKSN